MRKLTLDAIGLLNVGRAVERLLVAVVPDGYIGPSLGEALSDREADARAGAGDDGGLALQREEWEDLGLRRWLGLEGGQRDEDITTARRVG